MTLDDCIHLCEMAHSAIREVEIQEPHAGLVVVHLTAEGNASELEVRIAVEGALERELPIGVAYKVVLNEPSLKTPKLVLKRKGIGF